ncbi:aminodeoxychorismate synthase, component I [Terasakiispira papahanaumokuakeensis]|uniref:aminodeoxychorismate synthase n=1 Tax=Terasakiispira papahanaumokuakeensis TaxID=197479 RepID=A0A1E2VE82_9GAMM|nr:aminodeoxychorismate synthase component I [Terasakiispira papahanaumokuakeensis]ODC05172.1 aminodeoxychorismate synthase, component I [Terasakiispira papahanaumokuakeensis]
MSPDIQYLRLPYLLAPDLFDAIQHLEWPALLDSGYPDSPSGRFDIAVAAPQRTLTIQSEADVEQLSLLAAPRKKITLPSTIAHLPFVGGWLGHWSYDAGRLFETLPVHANPVTSVPWIRMGDYPWALVTDHDQQVTWLVGHDWPEALAQQLQTRSPTPTVAIANSRHTFQLTQGFQPDFSQADYRERFDQVMAYIQAGDCYQINLAQRFSAHYQGNPWTAYLKLRQATPTPFAAYLAQGEQTLLSLSPERFIELNRTGQLDTRPIKGTAPRSPDPHQDQHARIALQQSPKDRAENLMIVDLLRNDLGRVSVPGSVRVPDLFRIESFANVHHLVSTITSQLSPELSALDVLKACFPGGSITGAPKVRAMTLIDELEPCQRSAYCGAIGYIDVTGRMDFNIAIRTLIADQGQLHVWGGGGLVADSECESEYTETLNKISRLIQALDPDFDPKALA